MNSVDADAFAPLFAQESGEISYVSGSGDNRLALYSRYPEWQWIIAGSVSVDEIEAGVIAARDRFLLIALVLAAALSLTLYWIAKQLVTKPMNRAVGLAQALAEGDLSQRIETRRRDEIGQLVGAMNGIGDGLERIVSQVARISTLISEIRLASEEQSHGIEQINQAIAQIDETTQSNAALVRQSSASTQQLNDQSQRLAETVSVFRLRDDSALDRQEAALASPTASLTRHGSTEEPLPA